LKRLNKTKTRRGCEYAGEEDTALPGLTNAAALWGDYDLKHVIGNGDEQHILRWKVNLKCISFSPMIRSRKTPHGQEWVLSWQLEGSSSQEMIYLVLKEA